MFKNQLFPIRKPGSLNSTSSSAAVGQFIGLFGKKVQKKSPENLYNPNKICATMCHKFKKIIKLWHINDNLPFQSPISSN